MKGHWTPRRILLVRPSALGDVCRTVPVLASLKAAWPEASIAWVVQEGFEDAIRCHPALDEVVVFPRKSLSKWATRPWVMGRSIKWLMSLRQGGWDLVIDCQGLVRSGLMAFASGASVRIGDRHAREGGWLAYNHRVSTGVDAHTVDRMMSLLDPLGIEKIHDMQLHVPSESLERWASLRDQLNIDGPYLAMASTTRWPSKAWPDDHWVSLARSLDRSQISSIVMMGSGSEREEVGRLAARLRDEADYEVHDLSGRTTIGEMMAIIDSARLTIANDTAALHMAAGLGGRCVGLYGPTSPALVGPYGLDDQVVHVPPSSPVNYRDRSLGDRVMRGVPVDGVLEVARRVLANTVQASSGGDR